MGISGANFLVADCGAVALTTNEGNGRLSTSLPRIHVAVTGIEKVIPRLEDLGTLWPVLATIRYGTADYNLQHADWRTKTRGRSGRAGRVSCGPAGQRTQRAAGECRRKGSANLHTLVAPA